MKMPSASGIFHPRPSGTGYSNAVFIKFVGDVYANNFKKTLFAKWCFIMFASITMFLIIVFLLAIYVLYFKKYSNKDLCDIIFKLYLEEKLKQPLQRNILKNVQNRLERSLKPRRLSDGHAVFSLTSGINDHSKNDLRFFMYMKLVHATGKSGDPNYSEKNRYVDDYLDRKNAFDLVSISMDDIHIDQSIINEYGLNDIEVMILKVILKGHINCVSEMKDNVMISKLVKEYRDYIKTKAQMPIEKLLSELDGCTATTQKKIYW